MIHLSSGLRRWSSKEECGGLLRFFCCFPREFPKEVEVAMRRYVRGFFRCGFNFLVVFLTCSLGPPYRSSLLIYLFCNFVLSLCTETRGTSTAAISSRVETKRLGKENGLRSILQWHVSERYLPSPCPWDNRTPQSQDGKESNGKCFRTSFPSSKQARHFF